MTLVIDAFLLVSLVTKVSSAIVVLEEGTEGGCVGILFTGGGLGGTRIVARRGGWRNIQLIEVIL
jgi:hypothetical protein